MGQTTNITKHVGVLALTALLVSPVYAQWPLAGKNTTELRVATAGDQFSGTTQVASVFNYLSPDWTKASRVELGIGAFSSNKDARPFLSLGPVWRLQPRSALFYTEFGFSPTILGGSSFSGRDMGGNIHFTSSISAGWNFASMTDSSLKLRIQHISNGSLNSTNPGMDMIGFSFTTRF